MKNKLLIYRKGRKLLMLDYMEEVIKNTNFNQSKNIRDIVYEGLGKTIISGIIPVGERIIEKEYAEILNISRTPIREALKMLEIDELIEYLPKVGAVVKRVSVEDAIEIYKIRQKLEVLAVEAAMENITEDEIQEIKILLDLTEQKNKERDVKEVIRLFGEFNLKIYQASRMKMLAGMISKLNEYLQRFRNISISDDARREKALKEHREILDIITKKDKESIDTAIKNHLEYSLNIVKKEIK
ncbi:GntR family transcriptional regulator [Clostridium peptidivorans]|uniref:GntR family transcriptional regulator n=1 Tax=Clostridium peptidivorans TaxID=100174 RepID=UPI001FA81F7B|nr:GntR family transcriptional regulator [Clostridium peptidivorans]